MDARLSPSVGPCAVPVRVAPVVHVAGHARRLVRTLRDRIGSRLFNPARVWGPVSEGWTPHRNLGGIDALESEDVSSFSCRDLSFR